MTTRKEYSLRNTPIHPFVFRQRKEKLDWRRLASIDVNQVINEMDVGTLQDVLSSVAFCDITCEVDIRYVDGNLIKLFQLAQLLVEYLLHSQSYLISSVNSLKEENASLQKNLSSAKQDLAEKMNKLTAVRRECHRRRLLLLAQQQLMDSGPQSYHRCLYCPKAFLNASFLAAHVQRRHPETENIRHLPTLIAECGSQNNPLMAETVHIQTNSVQTNAMEKDVRDLLACLRSTSSKPEAGIPHQNKQFGGKLRHVTTHNGILDEFACKEVNATEENEKSDWKMAEEYRQELEALKRIFENELRDLRKQYEVTQADLAELKAKPAMSDVGEIVDDAAKVSSKKHPTKGAPTDYEATVKELSVRRVGVSATGLPSNLLPQEHPIVCDRSQIQASMGRMFERSEPKISKFSRQSSEHLSASFDGDSIYHLLKMHPVETDRPAFDNTRKTFKKALLGYEDSGGENKHEPVFDSTVLLPTTTCASTHPSNQNLDSSLLRHRRLLEQLRTDPQTIQGLRHEVERILNEHLVERNINIDQTRLSTSKFNEYLGALNRDRVHLCRKHLNFMKTREALAQHVDRLARAALSGRSGDRMASSIFCAGSQQSVKGRSLSRSRLPPSGVYSLGCVHQSSVPHSTQQHTNIHSRVGQSLPTLTGPEQEVQHFGISPFRSTGSIGLTQHRPQTRRYDPQIDTSSDTRADHQSLSSRGSSDRPGRSSRHSRFAATAQHSASHHHSGGSTSTFSPRTSLATYFSHDRRVVTFGPGRSDGKNITDTSNDNWNSSKEDLQNPVGRVERKLPIPDERTKGIGDNNEHDNDIRVISQSRPWQSNTNAHFTVPSAGGSTPGKVQSTRTDEEDVFSVSSINGNGNDQNSLEFNHETPHKQDADLFGACCSIDQSVIEAHAQSAALGPRPTTRFGSTDRQAP